MAARSKAREILNFTFLSALADDGLIDDSELMYIKSLALADGVVDEEEKKSLRRIFSFVDENELSDDAQREFHRFRTRYGV